jgi:hypothetical protein
MKFELTWFGPRTCWKKFAQGKVYYLGRGQCRGKWDTVGYQAALQEWRRITQDIHPYLDQEAPIGRFPAQQARTACRNIIVRVGSRPAVNKTP